MDRFRRPFALAALLLGSFGIDTPTSAGVIRYVLGEKSDYVGSPQLKQHFQPSDVYYYGSKGYESLIDRRSGDELLVPQDKHLGKIATGVFSWNKKGDAVGGSYVSANEKVGILFRNGEITYLSEQVPMTSQGAYAINESGQIVGGNRPLQGLPYFYQEGAFVPLDVLPGYASGRAIDINETGLAVGDNFRQGSGIETGVLYVGTQPYELTAITQGLEGRVVGQTHMITDDNRILATVWEMENGQWKSRSDHWLEPVILETGDIQEIWNEAKAAVTGGDIPLPPEDETEPVPGDDAPSQGDGTTVIDTETDGGFWTTPTEEVNGPDETGTGGHVTAPEPTPVPEPMSIVLWGAAGFACLAIRHSRRRRSSSEAID